LDKKIKKKQRKEIRKAMNKREKKFYDQQKKNLSNIFDRKLTFEEPFYLRDSDQIIMDEATISGKVEQFFKKIYTQNETDIAAQQEILDNVDENIYNNIMDKISMEEMTNTIKKLGNHKAPGESQITNDLLKIIKKQSYLDKLLIILNNMMEIEQLPEEVNLAKVILIPKREDWDGDISKTRPITLNDSIKKLFSLILTNRLTKIINRHNVLKGNNFGFRENHSTKDPLSIIRLLIDDARESKEKLYMASLDVQKAYDLVPFKSIIQALKRIKVPEIFIKNVIKILQRNVFIETPAGTTNILNAQRGLPQGDPMSPILWNIFYDELLIKLQEFQGYNINQEISIPVLAYADDIHPISKCATELQEMLGEIETFLKSHNMYLNAHKSKILTNDDTVDFNFVINNQIIKIIPKDELVRILGVFWSLDGKYKKTIQKTIEDLERQISAIQYKYIPGKIMTHIINTVIIPTIAYRLQYTPTSNTHLKKIDAKLRKLAKRKCKLPKNTKKDVFYDKNYGINLFSIKDTIQNQLITDISVLLRGETITSKILKTMLDKLQKETFSPIPLYTKPIPSKNKFSTQNTTQKTIEDLERQISAIQYKYIEPALPWFLN